ncbi:heme exporter protein CcmB [Saccharopolyspora indica]|uniref:heme exporter protein CcmB n=1 Tax=Saccharopolyspora indica TaxID=1229659 RepID=UPI0022EB16D9|nr:heme exporter protein CcmB [Saccharopolyspora indica]MDA3644083.1 heme exporter protein CcmB [Saccharopolyspora indica]
MKPNAVRQCAELALKDLRLELRAREVGLVIAPFGAVALLLIPMAVDASTALLRQLGPGMYWVVVLLFGVLVAVRDTAVEAPEQHAVLRLLGVEPAVLQMGRALANFVLVLLFELLLLPVSIALYDPDLTGWPWLLLALPLTAGGLALLGTIANSLARGLTGRSTIGPLMVVPIAVPLLLAAVQSTRAAGLGRAPWPWLLLIAVVDVAALLLLVLTAHHQEETA